MAGKFSFEVPAVAAPKGFPAINTIKNILHIVQALATFIVLCIIASVIATEYRFYVSLSFIMIRIFLYFKNILNKKQYYINI